MRFRSLRMRTGRKAWALRWPWGRWCSPGISRKWWPPSKAIFDIPARHWTRSRPIFEMAEAAFAEAIFIGLQLPPDCHTPRWECGNPGDLCGRRLQASVARAMTTRFAMRILLRSVWLLLMIPGLAYGQSAAGPAGSSTNTSDVGTQLNALRESLLRTQQQVAAQQQEIQILKAQLKGGQSGTGGAVVSAVEVIRTNPAGPDAHPSDP